MKKYFLYSICAAIISSFAAQATDNGLKDSEDTALKELRIIVKEAFRYPPKNENDQAQSQGENTSSSTSTTTASLVNVLNLDTLTYIVTFLDPYAFLSTTQTCTTMHTICMQPNLLLTDYFLVEGMLPCVPKLVLQRRIRSDKDGGIIRLSGRYCISAPFLKESFDQGDLERALAPHIAKIPSNFTGVILDEHLNGLYPIFKLHLAAYPEEDSNGKIATLLVQLNQALAQDHNKDNYLNYLSLLTLRPKNAELYYNDLYILHQHLNRQRAFFRAMNFEHLSVGVLAKQLLLVGHNVCIMSNDHFIHNPQKKLIVRKLIEWCYKHTREFGNAHWLIRDAREHLHDEELAYKIFQRLWQMPTVFVPYPNELLLPKIRAFVEYANDEHVKEDIKNFPGILDDNWQHLSQHYKKDALFLFIKAKVRPFIVRRFNELIKDSLMISGPLPNDDLLKELFVDCSYEEEAKQLIQLTLDSSQTYLCSIGNPYGFLKRAVTVNKEKTLEVSKRIIEKSEDIGQKLSILNFLADYDPTVEREYILERLKMLSLNDKNLNGGQAHRLASIFYHLKIHDSFIENFGKALEQEIQENDPAELQSWIALGLSITSLKQLKEHDPSKLMELIQKDSLY